MVEGFVVTTLDSAGRLNWDIFKELWTRLFKNVPSLLKKCWFNSGLSVTFMFFLAIINGYRLIWPVFGACNQLLAVLTLIAVTVWLNLAEKKNWFTFVLALIMIVTTITSLVYSPIIKSIPWGEYTFKYCQFNSVIIVDWSRYSFSLKKFISSSSELGTSVTT